MIALRPLGERSTSRQDGENQRRFQKDAPVLPTIAATPSLKKLSESCIDFVPEAGAEE